MNLNDTVKLMNSEDYKERFIAEYLQTKLRYDRLHRVVTCYEAGTLEFKPKCPVGLLKNQEWAMGKYLNCLEVRAQIEQIPLDIAVTAYESPTDPVEKIITNLEKAKVDLCQEFCDAHASDCENCPCARLAERKHDGVCEFFYFSEEDLDEYLKCFNEEEESRRMLPIKAAPAAEAEPKDNIHPQHYKLPGGMEVIDVEVAMFGKEAVMHHCFCTAAEYILRHMQKNGVEDIKKAHWWLEKYIELEASK